MPSLLLAWTCSRLLLFLLKDCCASVLRTVARSVGKDPLRQLDSSTWRHSGIFTNLLSLPFYPTTVVPGFSVLGCRALHGFRALCTGNQIWVYVINLPGFSALPGFKAPFYGDGQSALNPGTTVLSGRASLQILNSFHKFVLHNI